MLLNLGIPAVVCPASPLQHDFYTLHDQAMSQDHILSHPLQYLQSRFRGFANYDSASEQPKLPLDDESTRPDSLEILDSENNHDGPKTGRLSTHSTSKGKWHIVSPRTTTSFQIAHPPPAPRRFKLRSKVVLQLRQIVPTHSPVPAYEVLPSMLFTSSYIQRLPQMFNRHCGIGINDLVIVKSQSYDFSNELGGRTEDVSDDDDSDHRELVASICQPRKTDDEAQGLFQICLGDESVWTASRLPSSGYEFVSIDKHGTTTMARWVSRVASSRYGSSHLQDTPVTGDNTEKRFKFSILDPLARRHPVIASMDYRRIDILDQYNIPSTMSTAFADASSPYRSSARDTPKQLRLEDSFSPAKSMVDTDDNLRLLVLATGICVAFSEGWSDVFKHINDQSNSVSSVHTASSWRNRVLSGHQGPNFGSRSPTTQSVASVFSESGASKTSHRYAASTNSVTGLRGARAVPRRANSAAATLSKLGRRPSGPSTKLPKLEDSAESLETGNWGHDENRIHSYQRQRSNTVRHDDNLTDDQPVDSLGAIASLDVAKNKLGKSVETAQSSEKASRLTKSGPRKPGKIDRLLNYVNRKTIRSKQKQSEVVAMVSDE